MKRYLYLVALLLAAACVAATAGAETERPGTERWAVKIGADPDAATVRPVRNNPAGELARLTALPQPASLPENSRRSAERGIYTVAATVTQFKLEKDGDYHIVLSDGQRTMIAEIPEPAFCKQSRWRAQIREARQQFDSRYRVGDRFRYVSAPALVTGVLFFDFPHGQTGVAPNAVELHPVLSITWSGTASGRQPALRTRRHSGIHRPGHFVRTRQPAGAAQGQAKVWVNTRSGVYHYPGSRWYGTTKDGKFISEEQARAEGDRPAENGQ